MAVSYAPGGGCGGIPWYAGVAKGTGPTAGFSKLSEYFDISIEAILCADGWVNVTYLPWVSVSSSHILRLCTS